MTATAAGSNADTLRPESFDEFIGQRPLTKRLRVHITAALEHIRPLEHILLAGPPGFGKTALSSLIAKQMNERFHGATMPLSEQALTTIVREFDGVLLLDELHRGTPRQQENLLTLLESGYIVDNKGRRTQNSWLTVVGATTEPEKIIPPLTDRFPIKPTFDPYSATDMGKIVAGMARKAGVEMSERTAIALGSAAGGTPRNARQLVLAYRDLEIANRKRPTATDVMRFCDVQKDGLTAHHMAYLRTLHMLRGTAGLRLLSTSLRLHQSICMDLERLLVEKEFICYGERGRELTSAGFRRLSGGSRRSE